MVFCRKIGAVEWKNISLSLQNVSVIQNEMAELHARYQLVMLASSPPPRSKILKMFNSAKEELDFSKGTSGAVQSISSRSPVLEYQRHLDSPLFCDKAVPQEANVEGPGVG